MQEIITFIQNLYKTEAFIPLHEPRFIGNEKKYLNECIDSSFVSSVGAFVERFEQEFAAYVGSKYAIACVNGTAALHTALVVSDVREGDVVITQPLSFVATANAISYCGAEPIFLDVDSASLGLSPRALQNFLESYCELREGECFEKRGAKRVKACVPMHTFGHPCKIDTIAQICKDWGITLIEDAAESLGSYYKGRHTGTFGDVAAFSFNGNKIITSGGGGVVVTDDAALAKRAKHITTTAKVPHKWEYIHDEIGFNYRMPNLNAALLVAQMEQLEKFLANKRTLAKEYANFFATFDDITFVNEPKDAQSNYWLNTLLLKDKESQERFLSYMNEKGVMSRPAWRLLSELKMFQNCYNDGLTNAKALQQRIVNIPSSVRL
jgi:perosamine synthetase